MVAKVSGTVSLWCGRKETGAKGKRVFLHGQSLHNYHTRTPFLFFCSKGKKRRLNSRGRGLREYQDGKNGKFSIYPTPLICLSLSLSLSLLFVVEGVEPVTLEPPSLSLSPLLLPKIHPTLRFLTHDKQTARRRLYLFYHSSNRNAQRAFFLYKKGQPVFPLKTALPDQVIRLATRWRSSQRRNWIRRQPNLFPYL